MYTTTKNRQSKFSYKEHQDDLILSIKSFRQELEALVQHLKNNDTLRRANGQLLAFYPDSQELDIAITRLQESRMWLGKYLAYLGDLSPYTQGNDVSSTKVDDPADVIPIEESRLAAHLEHILANSSQELQKERSLNNESMERYAEISNLREWLDRSYERT